ncbi:tyrosyl-DNA phosphodiesterase-domain-containing protein [Gamsiella multidivaricata]|uniref:tyrosyl-DNA phosphodiesterase-domain-containing protein n=1 Tax=Gamsiella multidivaricata TaxID=101098 RepID=UPI00221F55B9|nr:tyrosyl-DNA phosphodiesterase-domain-containing protein [Gamsiella multidivaricata]KAG0364525.1 hypothetical protein BGZ54_007420 [Gamsiella multidivaricata]KAI7817511.1 tyrosyl-DNA phosphodiesterase-domain-containing protein [Gamsiella multidivaricata]
MDFDDEEAAIAEAIRLSLEESEARSRLAAEPAVHPQQQVIDLTDDLEPVKVERSSPAPMLAPMSAPMSPLIPVPMPASLANAHSSNSHDTVENQEEGDEDLERALALSLAEVKSAGRVELNREKYAMNADPVAEASSVSSAFGGLSRADMERERQERIKRKTMSRGTTLEAGDSVGSTKRKRVQDAPSVSTIVPPLDSQAFLLEASSPSVSSLPSLSSSSSASSSASAPASTTKIPRTSSKPVPSTKERVVSTSPPAAHEQAATMASSSGTPSHSVPAYKPEFLAATFRNTGIQGTKLGKWEIRFQDLVKKKYLIKAVLTSFQLDEEWLEEHIPPNIAQCIITHWTRELGEQPGFFNEGKKTYLHPPLNGFGSFHSKLMLLFYPMFCRVVITSANLVPHDWLQLVNIVYVQDFPLLPAPLDTPEELGQFGNTLHNFLKMMTVPNKVLTVLRCVDFTAAKILLVPSVQGSFLVSDEHTYGIAQLSKVLQPRISPFQELDIEYQTSSLGKMTAKFLLEFYKAARGQPVRARSKINTEEPLPPIKVVFPTENHVRNSRLGELGAGTVCFQSQYWDDLTYPKRVMHDFECVGALRGSLMHTKLVLAKAVEAPNTTGQSTSASTSTTTGQKQGPKCAGWLYVGSANFTESAWGSVTLRRSGPIAGQGLRVNIRNWELGVVYVIETEEEMESLEALTRAQGGESHTDDDDMQSFFGPLPVPYRRPLTPYTSNDRPWIR